jgi:hypothetical protein
MVKLKETVVVALLSATPDTGVPRSEVAIPVGGGAGVGIVVVVVVVVVVVGIGAATTETAFELADGPAATVFEAATAKV